MVLTQGRRGVDRRRGGTDVRVEEVDVGRRSSRSDVDEEEVPERLQLLAPGVVDVGVEDHDADVLRYPGAATSMAAVVFSSGWGWFLGWWLGFTEEEEEKEKRGVAAAVGKEREMARVGGRRGWLGLL